MKILASFFLNFHFSFNSSPKTGQIYKNLTKVAPGKIWNKLYLTQFKMIRSGKIKWIREESLADIAAIEMVDLPLADSEGAIEKQLKSDNGTYFL